MNKGTLSPAPPPPKPARMVTPSSAGKGIVPGQIPPKTSPAFQDYLRRAALRDGNFSPDLISKLAAAPALKLTELRPGTLPWQLVLKDLASSAVVHAADVTPAPPPVGGVDSTDARLLRTSLTGLFTRLDARVAVGPQLTPVDTAALSQNVVASLDPRITIPDAVRSRIVFAPGMSWNPPDPLEPVMAYPEFPQPMYEPLRDRSQDLMLAGLDQVPADTVSLLLTNQRFVEAYMVGLNHEMARELLWNEFPTDQRGSYFRQFWDVRGVPPSATAGDLRDIKAISLWPDTEALGANSARKPPPGGDYLVLLVRGELLRRYPNTIVYAVEAKWNLQTRARELGDKESHPLFKGSLNPDVSFFGFELTPSDVRGGKLTSEPPGWFFVLQEQPSECRFGLDTPAFPPDPLNSWNDLSWSHLAADQDALNAIVHIDLNAGLPDTSHVVPAQGDPIVAWHADMGTGPSGTHSSDLAFITLQRPVRIAVHASDMLPKGA
jgi:hypothetical protein